MLRRVITESTPFLASLLFPCPFAKSLRGNARRIQNEVIEYGGCKITIESSVGSIPSLKDVIIGMAFYAHLKKGTLLRISKNKSFLFMYGEGIDGSDVPFFTDALQRLLGGVFNIIEHWDKLLVGKSFRIVESVEFSRKGMTISLNEFLSNYIRDNPHKLIYFGEDIYKENNNVKRLLSLIDKASGNGLPNWVFDLTQRELFNGCFYLSYKNSSNPKNAYSQDKHLRKVANNSIKKTEESEFESPKAKGISHSKHFTEVNKSSNSVTLLQPVALTDRAETLVMNAPQISELQNLQPFLWEKCAEIYRCVIGNNPDPIFVIREAPISSTSVKKKNDIRIDFWIVAPGFPVLLIESGSINKMDCRVIRQSILYPNSYINFGLSLLDNRSSAKIIRNNEEETIPIDSPKLRAVIDQAMNDYVHYLCVTQCPSDDLRRSLDKISNAKVHYHLWEIRPRIQQYDLIAVELEGMSQLDSNI